MRNDVLPNGTVVEGYRIDGIVGQGGMGVVYEATDVFIERRRVALKLIGGALADEEGYRNRFKREAEIQADLEHPHIVPVYRAGESPYGLYIAMRLVNGPNLKELIAAGKLDAARTARLLTQIAGALDAAHAVGLIHRDIKPNNILVDEHRDHAYLADFGIAKAQDRVALTRFGELPGTPDYISPEQIRGEPAVTQSDVYALGTVLFECLTGSVPFPKDSDVAVLYAHLSDPIPSVTDVRPDLPKEVDEVVQRAMCKEPAERYAAASDLMLDLQHALGEGIIALPPPSGPEQVRADRTTDAAVTREQERIAGETAPAEPVRAAETVLAPGTPATPPPATPAPTTHVPAPTEPGTPAPTAPSTPAPATALSQSPVAPASPTVVTPEPAAEPPRAQPTVEQTTPPSRPTPPTQLRPSEPQPPAPVAKTPATVIQDVSAGGVGVAGPPEGGFATPAPVPAAGPARRRPSAAAVAALIGAPVVVAIAVGFFAGRAGVEADQTRSTVATDRPVTLRADQLRVTAPAGWERAPASSELTALSLPSTLSARSAPTAAGVTLLAGRVDGRWPSYLPRDLRRRLTARDVQTREIVRIGEQKLTAFRWRGVRPRGFDGQLTLFMVPQAKSVTALACAASQSSNALAACERAVGTLSLQGAKRYPLAPSRSYASQLNGALSRLSRGRSSGLRALGAAQSQAAQAAAANQIATAYGTAATSLRRATTTPHIRPVHADVLQALAQTQRAYTALSSAANRGDRTAWANARAQATRAEAALRRTVAELRLLGFSVRG